MKNLRADLHIHTYYSDGLLSPSEVVASAKNAGLDVIAITDHDTALAANVAKPLAQSAGLKLIPGIEVSAYKGKVKLHTLGYNVDSECAVFKNFSAELLSGSLERAEDIVTKLNRCGVKISMDEVFFQRRQAETPVHAMHIARAGAAKGYAENAFSFYLKYLAADRCAYSQVGRPSPERAVEVISASGGFASLAHPGRIEMGKEELISLVKRLSECGLSGIEAVYSTHTDRETAYYKEMAKTFNLVVTGGSDTHFNGGRKRIGDPVFYLGEALAERLGIELR